ncbi:response regulator transcription factor [Marinoscillum sp. MHG1-6]|uniref:response regulator n=1 Tax=Marinoscillum sp. MHG1-6 TaxID=2959627 RepID=UPI002157DC75|nr:response regulator transcription factor [Marinoscillum sp. MHG1-6]
MNKILLVEDHEMIRDAIKNYLDDESEYMIKDEAESGLEALELLKGNSYDLILTDINMPEMDGIEMMGNIQTLYPNQKVMVLTMFNDLHQIKKMIEQGVNGYILKNATKKELMEAMRTIINGENYYAQEIYSALIQSMSKRKSKERLTYEQELSDREKEVLVLIAQELSNQEIADQLFISIRTVETHKRNLLEKTGCKNVAGLVLFAVEKGII